MKRCKHKHVEARFWSQYFKDWKVIPATMPACNPDALVCRDCGEWLGLGESDETPVADEVEAARLAVHMEFRDFPDDEPDDEAFDYGWEAHALGCDVYDGTWHGWLSREIHTHSEPQ